MSKGNGELRPASTRQGFFARIGYFFSRALTNFRQNLFVSVVTVGTITLALLIASLFLLVYVNLEEMSQGWSEKVQVTAYFDKEPVPATVASLKQRVMALKGTAKVRFVSQTEAETRFRKRLKGQESLLEGITPDVLPSSFEITLDRSHREGEEVDAYVKGLKRIPGIAEVQYGEEWVKRFGTFMNFLRLVGAVLGSFLALSVLFIISNTIKLTVYARKEELELLALVGATRFFIKAPFVIEGGVQGALGAIASLVILTGCYYLFLNNAGNFLSVDPASYGLSFLPATYLAGILAGGVLLGLVGSLASLRRFVK